MSKERKLKVYLGKEVDYGRKERISSNRGKGR